MPQLAICPPSTSPPSSPPPPERCFDLSRSPSFHTESTRNTQERVVEGDPHKLLELNDVITWEAVHFFVRQRLMVRITAYRHPYYFVDEQVAGAFKSMRHTHTFAPVDGGTIMTDEFEFSSPLGWLGWVVDRLVLKRYLTTFIKRRNLALKAKLLEESSLL